MVLCCYFQPSDSLPDLSGLLSASVSPAVIKDANKAVRSATRSHARGRGNAQVHTKIRIQKFLLKALWPFVQKFAPPKMSRYMVVLCRAG